MSYTPAYGYIPDLPDQRDHYLKLAPPVTGLPPSVDLRPQMPPIYDQGNLGSCTGNAIGGADHFERMKQGLDGAEFQVPSRLFIYYFERDLENSIHSDSGAQIRDGIKVLNCNGACFEDLWPYDISKFTVQPTDAAQQAAKSHVAIKYARIDQTENQMKACLAHGWPFIIGFTVYESFESDQVARTGIAPMPGKDERTVGGHAVLVVGYDDATGRWLVRNSWGTGWGMAGYFTIPYEYFTDPDLAEDIWNIQAISG